jgi:ferredoxin
MCEFCTKHGEGEKWYLNTRNYGHDLLSDITRRRFVKEHLYWIDESYRKYYSVLKALPLSMPVIGPALRAIIKRKFLYQHWGQVLPIEDVEKVLDMTNSIVRIPCVCRKVTTGKEVRTCFLISLDPEKMELSDLVDMSYFGSPDVSRFESMGKKEALDFFRQSERRGMIHTIWSLRAPFIGELCNCDLATGCIPMRMYKDVVPVVFRAEYTAVVEEARCKGCGACVKVCQFGAITLNKSDGKAVIGQKRCYGCGICRSLCNEAAIAIRDRRSVDEAMRIW